MRALYREAGTSVCLSGAGAVDPRRYARYRCTGEGQFRCLMMSLYIALEPLALGVVPGSHKADLPCPRSMTLGQAHQEHVLDVHGKAGDVVIFTETLTHGTLPWKGVHQRRALLYKFSPGFQAYSAGAHTSSPCRYRICASVRLANTCNAIGAR